MKNSNLTTQATTPVAGTMFQSDVSVLDPLEVLVPEDLLNTCKNIQDRFRGLEWSILVKGSMTERGYEIGDDFVIPKQEVGSSEVNFTDRVELEGYRSEGYNCIIHSHPFKSDSFSGSDRKTLSVNYDCSILYSMGSFTTATVSFKMGTDNEALLVLDTKVSLLTTYIALPANIDTLITKIEYTRPSNACYGADWYKGRKVVDQKPEEVHTPVKTLSYLEDLYTVYGANNEFRC